MARTNQLHVLTYHRIGDRATSQNSQYYPGMISTGVGDFRAHMNYVKKNYRTVSMDEVLSATRGQTLLPDRAVLVTFDDGCEDFDELAWPILKEAEIPTTLFIPTNFPDSSVEHFWWDRLYRAVYRSPAGTKLPTPWGNILLTSEKVRTRWMRRLRDYLKTVKRATFEDWLKRIIESGGVPDPVSNGVMGWEKLKHLASEGLTLAAHSKRHFMVNHLDDTELEEELGGSRKALSEAIGQPVLPVFAYPSGGVNAEVIDNLKRTGFEVAFTTDRGANLIGKTNPLSLRRINVGSRTSLGILHAELALFAGRE